MIGRSSVKSMNSSPVETQERVGQTSEGAAAQIQDIEMAGGMSFPINDGIMTGGLVPVAVTGIEVKIIQLGEDRQLIGQIRFEAGSHELIDFLKHLEPARAAEGMEVMGILGTDFQIRAMGLEESPTGCRFMQGALDADGDPDRVGKCWANSQGGASRDELQGWFG
jgi:hypothetical protein